MKLCWALRFVDEEKINYMVLLFSKELKMQVHYYYYFFVQFIC